MENEPSPLNIFFPEKDNISSNRNLENQKEIMDSPISSKSKSQIKEIESPSNQKNIKKSNNLFIKEINMDISSSQEENINENDILGKLKNRFNDNIYFTNINKNLIFLNAFCNEEDIFGKDMKVMFKTITGNVNERDNKNYDSHLFSEINKIIMDLKKNNYNKNSILIQGDSYSGKSKLIKESIIYLLNYFNPNEDNLTEANNIINNINTENNFNSNYSNKNYRTVSLEEGFYSGDNNKLNLINLPKKILAGLTILDAFGKAKTESNDNSTRSINYIKLRFNKSCHKIIGMEIFPFLFDKNRISNKEENKGYNYNIFYYLLNCEDSNLLSELFLSNDINTNYNYLQGKENIINNNESSFNENKFFELKSALITTGFSNDEILIIFKLLAAIILLGNVELNLKSSFSSSLNKNETLLNVCKLLNIDINEFVSA